MRRVAVLAAVLLATAARAQPGTAPAADLEKFHRVQISNGLITAQVYPPGENEAYRGTRFDHAGVAFHVTYKGQDFSTYWFERFVTDPRDTKSYPNGTVPPCCSVSGPVEEFGAVGFEEAGMGGRFLKPGIGIFTRDNDDPLKFPTLPALNDGTRTFKATKTSATFTQDITDVSGYGYHYVKTVRLVPGKPQLVIEHAMTNTGSKPIETTVFCHNFLTLETGNEHTTLTAPFAMRSDKPFAPGTAVIEGKILHYQAPIKPGETVMRLLNGFGPSASDYDFTVANTATGFGQRIRGDRPIVKINMWSIPATYSIEPYIAVSIKPGETQHWSYTYDYFGPGDKR